MEVGADLRFRDVRLFKAFDQVQAVDRSVFFEVRYSNIMTLEK